MSNNETESVHPDKGPLTLSDLSRLEIPLELVSAVELNQIKNDEPISNEMLAAQACVPMLGAVLNGQDKTPKLDLGDADEVSEMEFKAFLDNTPNELTAAQREKLEKYFGISVEELRFFRKYKKVMRWLGLNSAQLSSAVESHKRASMMKPTRHDIPLAFMKDNYLHPGGMMRRSFSRTYRKNYFDENAEPKLLRSKSKLENFFGLDKESYDAFIRYTLTVEKIVDVLGEMPTNETLQQLQRESASKAIDSKLENWESEKKAAAKKKRQGKNLLSPNDVDLKVNDDDGGSRSLSGGQEIMRKKYEKQLGLSASALRYFDRYSKVIKLLGGAPDDFSVELESRLKEGDMGMKAVHHAAHAFIKRRSRSLRAPSIGTLHETDSFQAMRPSSVRSMIRTMTLEKTVADQVYPKTVLSDALVQYRNMWKDALIILSTMENANVLQATQQAGLTEVEITSIEKLVNTGSFDYYIADPKTSEAVALIASLNSENFDENLLNRENLPLNISTAADSLIDFLIPLSSVNDASVGCSPTHSDSKEIIGNVDSVIPITAFSHGMHANHASLSVPKVDYLRVMNELQQLKRVASMQKGDVLVKIDAGGSKSARKRWFVLSGDQASLSWGDEVSRKISTTIFLSSIVGIEFCAFQDEAETVSHFRSFSLIAKDRRYDFTTLSHSQLDIWYLGLQGLVEKDASKLSNSRKLLWTRMTLFLKKQNE